VFGLEDEYITGVKAFSKIENVLSLFLWNVFQPYFSLINFDDVKK